LPWIELDSRNGKCELTELRYNSRHPLIDRE
jgi:hypothetical protein